MAYSKAVLDKALSQLSQRRGQVRAEQERRKREIHEKIPQIAHLERDLSSTSILLAKAILSGTDVEEKVAMLRQANLSMQAERARLLDSKGYPINYLETRPFCPICEDSGYTDKGMCSCLQGLARQAAYKEVYPTVDLGTFRFGNFNLSYYSDRPEGNNPSPRAVMTRTYSFCKSYADTFSPRSPSLFFQGMTGLGKTHLTLAITSQVMEQGYYVIYSPMQNLVSRLEKEHFGRAPGDQDTMALVLECDLLALDDLGAEFSTNFSISALYTILNTRMNEGRPTIISSNLEIPKIQEKYTDRITSRLIGGCSVLPFVGADIRTMRR